MKQADKQAQAAATAAGKSPRKKKEKKDRKRRKLTGEAPQRTFLQCPAVPAASEAAPWERGCAPVMLADAKASARNWRARARPPLPAAGGRRVPAPCASLLLDPNQREALATRAQPHPTHPTPPHAAYNLYMREKMESYKAAGVTGATDADGNRKQLFGMAGGCCCCCCWRRGSAGMGGG